MIDLHTHILPQMDDGSSSTDESIAMLRMELQQGVSTVCLTPHYLPENEAPTAFLQRREAAYANLLSAISEPVPELILGAEVAWFPTLHQFDALESLCLGDSQYFLLEMPFQPWSPHMLDRLYLLPDSTGLTPLLAHVERYLPFQSKGCIKDLLSMGFPMQVNAESLQHRGRKLLSLLTHGEWYLGSDCHNTAERSVNYAQGAAFLREKLGRQAEQLLHWQL